MKILLTEVLLRKTFDVINIIKRNYPKSSIIYTIPSDSFFTRLKLKFFYGAKQIQVLRDDANFYRDLDHISETYKNDIIIYVPIEESITLRFLNYIDLKDVTNYRYLLPKREAFILSRNKESLNLFCEKHNIPSPKYISKDIFKNKVFNFPIIKKPKHGSGAKGLVYIENEDQLKKLHIDFQTDFIQEKLPKPKNVEAGFGLCKKGELLSFYSHKRIRTYPEKGGVTVYSKYNKSEKLERLSGAIIKKLNWSGLIMIEFLFDERDGKYKVIEVNPRLWGSVLLSEFCGANFLTNYIEIANGSNVKPSKIKEDTYIRWIFPYDILFWIKHISNPIEFFKIKENTCYINFTYSSFTRSILFIVFTYFRISNLKKIIGYE